MQYFKISLRSLAAGVPEVESIIAATARFAGAQSSITRNNGEERYELEDYVFGQLTHLGAAEYAIALCYPRNGFQAKRPVDVWFCFSANRGAELRANIDGAKIPDWALHWYWPGDLDDLGLAVFALRDFVLAVENDRVPAFGGDAFEARRRSLVGSM